MRAKITKRVVDAVKAGSRDVFVWDTEVKGFGLKVTPQGRRVYVLQYRLPGTPTRRLTIGVHGSPWTPDAARGHALEALGDVAKGKDPAEVKRAAKADISISALCDLYLEQGVRTKKASTIEADKSRINSHVKPLLGSKRLRALNKADVDRFLREIAAGKSAKNERTRPRGRSVVRGGEGVANRSLGMLGAILQFAVHLGLRPDNPARGAKKFKEGRRSRYLSNEELAKLGEALREAEADGVNRYAVSAIRLLVLTGCRKSEILTLRWDEVDFDAGFLRLKDSKTGAKNVHLTAPARAVLAELPQQRANPFVICGAEAGEHLVGLQKPWAQIREKAGIADLRLHDLRHSYASVGARSGESLLVIGKVLGHATAAATNRYAHLSDDPVAKAANSISHRIAAAMDARAESPAQNASSDKFTRIRNGGAS